MEEANEYRCSSCGRVFRTSQALASHEYYKCSDNRQDENALAEGPRHERESPQPKRGAITKPQSLDAVIEELHLPGVPEQYDGNWNAYIAGFNEGMRYGARTILAGIRAAQELSSLGIAQATPIIKMAQEMRQAEGQVAEKAVTDVMGKVVPYLDRKLDSLEQAVEQKKPDVATLPNPIMGVMARVLETTLAPMVEKMMAGLILRPSGGPAPGAGGTPSAQTQPLGQGSSSLKEGGVIETNNPWG